jgi:DNA-binding YbaB/EbfC family protein
MDKLGKMFGNLGKLGDAAGMMKKLQEVQGRLEKTVVTGVGGGGMVRVQVSGARKCVGVELDPLLLTPEKRRMAEDLVKAAVTDALAQMSEAEAREQMAAASSMMGELGGLMGHLKHGGGSGGGSAGGSSGGGPFQLK